VNKVSQIIRTFTADHLDKVKPLTSESPHVCREPFSVDDRAVSDPLLAPVTQWGHAPFPLNPMTPHAVSRQARDLLEGIITVHRTLPVLPTADEPAPTTLREVVAAGYSKQQVRAAWDRRRADLADLAGVAEEFAAVDQRVAELDRRVSQLLTMATAL
jgi:hypothetical protein